MDGDASAEARQQLPHQLHPFYDPPSSIPQSNTDCRPQSSANQIKSSSNGSPVHSAFTSSVELDSSLLSEIERELRILESYSGPQALTFIQDPRDPQAPSSYIPPADHTAFNSGLCALKPAARINQAFLWSESRLCSLLLQVRELDDTENRVEVEAKVDHVLDVLHSYKAMEWDSQRSGENDLSISINTGQSRNTLHI